MKVFGTRSTTTDITTKAKRLATVNGLLSSLKKEKELLEAELTDAMTIDIENEEFYQFIKDSVGNIICEYKSRNNSHFDSVQFKVDEPTLYEQYMKHSVTWNVKTLK